MLVRWGDPARHPFPPLIAAIVLSVHPVHTDTEPVEWIAGITDLSYTAFGLLALIACMRAFRRVGFAPVAGALLLISLLCKETGAVILLLMILLEWFEARVGRSRAPRAPFVRLALGFALDWGELMAL